MNRPMLAAITGGTIGGALDITYAIVLHGARGVPAISIFQSIASGLLGRAAFDGGADVAVLGCGLHFAMAILMATVFVSSAKATPRLRQAPLASGLLYGIILFVVMNFVVVPLSAAPFEPPRGWLLAGSLFAHTVLVAIPIAFATRHILD